MKPQYIGFGNSQKFMEAIDPARPVNVFVGRMFGNPDRKYGLATDSIALLMTQVRELEVLYLYDIVLRFRVQNGHILERDEERPMRLATQVFDLARQWLKDHDIPSRDAMLSMPTNLIILEGNSLFMQFNKESDAFDYQPDKVAAL